MEEFKFPPAVAEQLGYYVYIYIDPIDDSVFYVGKGKGNRAFAHLNTKAESRKAKRIAEIKAQGEEPRIEILVHGLQDEQTALKIEAAIIDLLNDEKLTNEVRGYESSKHGRMTLRQIQAEYGAEPVEITDPVMIIRISKAYRHTLNQIELYDRTRAMWVVGPKRNRIDYVLSVYSGVVREVYEVKAWLPGGSTLKGDKNRQKISERRWEFVGTIADEKIRKKYLFKDVTEYLVRGNQNPIIYVNARPKGSEEVDE